MNIKKLVIGFVIALSAAFALNFASKTALQNKDIEFGAEQQTLLFAGRNRNWERILNFQIIEKPCPG